jgi:hypothetical protein
MAPSLRLRAVLSQRLRHRTPARWKECANLWTAFNAMYGGEPDARERARVMNAVRQYVSAKDARNILARNKAAIAELVALPPSDMRRERWDPRFRAATQRCVNRYNSPTQSPADRLAAVSGILYQVRCNLVHGSKDPDNTRDRMLVRASLQILEDLVPAVEAGMIAADS